MLGLGLGWRDRAPEVSIGGDEVTYTILSRSLEQGRYRDEFLIGTPPHVQYPPGVAVWLLAIRRIAGPALDRARAANLILLALTALLIGDAVRRLTAPWLGVGAVTVVVLNPLLSEVSGTLLSESPYIALTTLSLWAALRANEEQRRRWWVIAIGLGGLAFLTRTVGIALVGGLVAWCLLRRRWALAAGAGLFGLVVVGGWVSYLYRYAPAAIGHSYMVDLAPILSRPSVGGASIASAALRHLKFYVLDLLWVLRLPTVEGTPIDNLAWYLVVAGCGGFGAWILFRRWSAAAATLVLSLAILLGWMWHNERLLLPLLPVGIAGLLIGAFALAQALRARAPARFGCALAFVMGGSALMAQLQHPRWINCDRTNPYGDPSCFNPVATSLVRAAWVIQDSLSIEAVIATSRPSTVYYFSGRQAFPLAKALQVIQGSQPAISGAEDFTHILFTEELFDAPAYVSAVLRQHCHTLQVAANVEHPFVLLAVRSGPLESDNACFLWER